MLTMHQMGVIFNPLLLMVAFNAISFAYSGKHHTLKQKTYLGMYYIFYIWHYIITLNFLLGFVYVNHIYDRPGYFTCERVPSNDPCLSDRVCELENECPRSNGRRSGILYMI